MCERTVTIPLEEYEELTREDLVYRYSAGNGHTYHWYGVVPAAKEIEDNLKRDYDFELTRLKKLGNDEWREKHRIREKLMRIPKFIRKIYGAE